MSVSSPSYLQGLSRLSLTWRTRWPTRKFSLHIRKAASCMPTTYLRQKNAVTK